MNIVYRDIFDKIGVFKAAGDSTDGYDYAIPQAMFDDLLKMGIEEPGRWFVADCSGPCAFPKLRHIGEAIYTILHARSKANEEITKAHVESGEWDSPVWEIIMQFAGNQVCNEADAGFVDYNIVIGLITEAYAKGRKSALVNENDHIMESPIFGGGVSGIAKCRVVLRPHPIHPDNGYVVHILNTEIVGYSFGRYYNTKQQAVEGYMDRCREKGVDPFE